MIPTHRFPSHPGEMLREEFVKPYGMRQGELAERLGISRRRVNEILSEKRAITADTALRLSKLFGTSAEFWLNGQAAYDLAVARKKTRLGTVRAITARERRAAEKRGLGAHR